MPGGQFGQRPGCLRVEWTAHGLVGDCCVCAVLSGRLCAGRADCGENQYLRAADTRGLNRAHITHRTIGLNAEFFQIKWRIEKRCLLKLCSDSKSNTSGLGLGIYIIKSTLETQGLELDYFHQNNQNIFIIKGVVSQKNLKDENV